SSASSSGLVYFWMIRHDPQLTTSAIAENRHSMVTTGGRYSPTTTISSTIPKTRNDQKGCPSTSLKDTFSSRRSGRSNSTSSSHIYRFAISTVMITKIFTLLIIRTSRLSGPIKAKALKLKITMMPITTSMTAITVLFNHCRRMVPKNRENNSVSLPRTQGASVANSPAVAAGKVMMIAANATHMRFAIRNVATRSIGEPGSGIRLGIFIGNTPGQLSEAAEFLPSDPTLCKMQANYYPFRPLDARSIKIAQFGKVWYIRCSFTGTASETYGSFQRKTPYDT